MVKACLSVYHRRNEYWEIYIHTALSLSLATTRPRTFLYVESHSRFQAVCSTGRAVLYTVLLRVLPVSFFSLKDKIISLSLPSLYFSFPFHILDVLPAFLSFSLNWKMYLREQMHISLFDLVLFSNTFSNRTFPIASARRQDCQVFHSWKPVNCRGDRT